MEGEPASVPGLFDPGDGVGAFDQGAENGGWQRRRALDSGAPHGAVGLEEKIAHLPGPLLLVDVDQGLEFAQVMGLAQRVPDAAGHRVIGLEVIVDDDAAAKALGQIAAFGRHPVRGQGRGRGGMQPLAPPPLARVRKRGANRLRPREKRRQNSHP